MPSKPETNLSQPPAVKISGRGAARLKHGHVWVYRSDILADAELLPGSLVRVTDERGKMLGSALYSTASQIAIRMVSPGLITDSTKLLRARIQAAIAYRQRIVNDTDAYRLIFSEGDSLPGLIVDRYNDILCLQILTQAMDAPPMREVVISELVETLKPTAIAEKVDPRIRELEQLPDRSSGLLYGQKTETTISMNGVRFHYTAMGGQKTGAFLDQRENYAAAAQYARGEALDVFCYHGGFALHLASNCSRVTGVDSSRSALEEAERNAALNGREVEWIEANAFDLLKDYSSSGKKYDTIVLDPPAFAKNKHALDTALRGYKELQVRAFKMLRPGGTLVTCSCSHHVTQQAFLQVIAEASRDVAASVRIVEARGQAKDHPVLPTVPETSYLKCFIICVS
jgi:23S rRNA (cytosine1962-C5)-methyltransferase